MTIETLPMAEITQAALVGEPATDKAFLAAGDGRTYRVRVLQVLVATPEVTMAPEDRPSPFLRGFDVSAVRLGSDGLPERTAIGEIVLFGPVRWTLTTAEMAIPGFSAADTLMMVIRNLVAQGVALGAQEAAVGALIADWGGGPVEEAA